MIVGPNIFVMLLADSYFKTFTPKAVADASKTTEVLVSVSAPSRARVDEMVGQALAAGGKAPNPAKDHGLMYQHGFEDFDGHIWELVYMNPDASEMK